ncbi:hypothetical protein ABZT06_46725, partial [Streptomyces sp. NPDC005483]
MAQFDTGPIRDLAREWIQYGDGMYELAQSMQGQIEGMHWTSKAATAARDAFSSGDHSVRATMLASADMAWKTGEALNIYAEEVDKAVKEINKQRLIAALANIFGLALMGITIGLGVLLAPYLQIYASFAAQMFISALELQPGMVGAATAFSFEVALSAGLGLGFDLLNQQLAHSAAGAKYHVDWKNEAWALGLGATGPTGKPVAGLGERWIPKPERGGPQSVTSVTQGIESAGVHVPTPTKGLPNVNTGKGYGFSEAPPAYDAPPAYGAATTAGPDVRPAAGATELSAPQPLTAGPTRSSSGSGGKTTDAVVPPAPTRASAGGSEPGRNTASGAVAPPAPTRASAGSAEPVRGGGTSGAATTVRQETSSAVAGPDGGTAAVRGAGGTDRPSGGKEAPARIGDPDKSAPLPSTGSGGKGMGGGSDAARAEAGPAPVGGGGGTRSVGGDTGGAKTVREQLSPSGAGDVRGPGGGSDGAKGAAVPGSEATDAAGGGLSATGTERPHDPDAVVSAAGAGPIGSGSAIHGAGRSSEAAQHVSNTGPEAGSGGQTRGAARQGGADEVRQPGATTGSSPSTGTSKSGHGDAQAAPTNAARPGGKSDPSQASQYKEMNEVLKTAHIRRQEAISKGGDVSSPQSAKPADTSKFTVTDNGQEVGPFFGKGQRLDGGETPAGRPPTSTAADAAGPKAPMSSEPGVFSGGGRRLDGREPGAPGTEPEGFKASGSSEPSAGGGSAGVFSGGGRRLDGREPGAPGTEPEGFKASGSS